LLLILSGFDLKSRVGQLVAHGSVTGIESASANKNRLPTLLWLQPWFKRILIASTV